MPVIVPIYLSPKNILLDKTNKPAIKEIFIMEEKGEYKRQELQMELQKMTTKVEESIEKSHEVHFGFTIQRSGQILFN